MDFMSTATVVAIVVVLMLLGLGIVINQLLRLRKYLNGSPPGPLPGGGGGGARGCVGRPPSAFRECRPEICPAIPGTASRRGSAERLRRRRSRRRCLDGLG